MASTSDFTAVPVFFRLIPSLRRPVGAVFVCLLALLCSGTTLTSAESRSFRLVVWNLRNYQEADPLPTPANWSPLGLEKEVPAALPKRGLSIPPKKKGAEEVKLLVETLVRLAPDVAALVEMGPPKPHLASLQQRLALAGLNLPHALVVDGPDSDRHVVLLSAFPIKENLSVPWAEIAPAGSARYVSRGFLDAVIEPTPGQPLHLWAVHLKSAHEEDMNPETIRREEAITLRELLIAREMTQPKIPVLVVGDFNDDRASASLKQIQGLTDGGEPHLNPLPLEDALGDHWTHYWNTEDAYTRIDFALANPAARALVQKEGTFIERYPAAGEVSDHRPLVITLKLPAKKDD